jgi:hypothetical protein
MTADQIARLAIALDEVEPPVRRRIEVPLTIRLDRLHQVFQVVMGWENYHLYEFRIGRDIAYRSAALFSRQRRFAVVRAGDKRNPGREAARIW